MKCKSYILYCYVQISKKNKKENTKNSDSSGNSSEELKRNLFVKGGKTLYNIVLTGNVCQAPTNVNCAIV